MYTHVRGVRAPVTRESEGKSCKMQGDAGKENNSSGDGRQSSPVALTLGTFRGFSRVRYSKREEARMKREKESRWGRRLERFGRGRSERGLSHGKKRNWGEERSATEGCEGQRDGKEFARGAEPVTLRQEG